MSYAYHQHLTFAPRLPVVELPAYQSPRPASARPPSRSWWPFNRQTHTNRAQPAPFPNLPPPFVPRTSQDFGVRTNPNPYQPQHQPQHQHQRHYSESSRPGYVPYTPSLQQDLRDVMTAAPGQGGYTPKRAVSRSKTPLASVTSRMRSHSLSSNRSQVPIPRSSPPPIPLVNEPPKQWSKPLSQTMGPATRARGRLKEESISLSWPLVKYTKSSKRSRNPLLYFDVGFDPRQHNNLKDNSTGQWLALSNADCHLSASTHCELTSMVIECPLIGPVNIDRPGGICVLDVFSAIYDAYHVRLSSEERPDDVDGRYEATFRKRCEDFKPYPAAEARRGMRRVDLLRGKRIFDGITREGAHWKVELVAR